MATAEALKAQRQLPLEQELADRVKWFVFLRWLAGGAVLLLGLVTALLYPQAMPWAMKVSSIGGIILLVNVGFAIALHRHRAEGPDALARSSLLQVSADLLALTLLVHLSGGVASPFLFFYVFHMIIASFLLPRRLAVAQVVLAAVLVGLVAILEGRSVLPHTVLPWLQPHAASYRNPEAFLRWGIFTVGMCIAAFLATSLAGALRVREERLVAVQQELTQAYMKLEELENARLQFVLRVTHSLRSPVAAIQGMIRVLMDGYAGAVSERLRELLDRIERRADFLMQLVNDLLALAAQEQEIAVSEFQAVRMADVLGRAVDAVRGRADGRGVHLEVLLPEDASQLVVDGRQEDLERIITELLENAVKYTPAGGYVYLRASTAADFEDAHIAESKRKALAIEVQDTGIGIPPEARERVFQEFYRAPNAKQVVEHGTGLGLAISQRVAKEHGGSITLESEVGKGSRFVLWLPLSRMADDPGWQ